MEITVRGLWTMIHGMGFGALYLMACSGALVELYRRYTSPLGPEIKIEDERFLRIYLTAMAVLAWLAVLTGAYVIYPWYRAVPPPGTANLAAFPQRLLMSNPSTTGWHSIGMEWKEHVAWLVPISITMAAAVFSQYRPQPQSSSGTSRRGAGLCVGLASRRGHRRLLRRDAQQERAGYGRPDDHSRRGRPKMSVQVTASTPRAMLNPNGAGAAAVLAAGIGSLAVAVFAIVADKAAPIKSLMNFYKPTGPLSGVTTCAIVVWLAAWALLHRRWSQRSVAVGRVTVTAFILLFLGLLLTFPPIADLM